MRYLVAKVVAVVFCLGGYSLTVEGRGPLNHTADYSNLAYSGMGNHSYDSTVTPNSTSSSRPSDENKQTSTRFHTDGIAELTFRSFSPLRINIFTPAFTAVGTIDIQVRNQTTTDYELNLGDIPDETNVWDFKGRGILVPGKLTCRVSYRTTLSDYKKLGLTLGFYGPNGGGGIGGDADITESQYWEASKHCAIGPVPAGTTHEEIASLCTSCLRKVKKTLEQDVASRMNNLSYLVKETLCRRDNDCGKETRPGSIGRCVLKKDGNGSAYTQCEARGTVGGDCAGKYSSGMFQYPCDKGLVCTLVHEGKGFLSITGYDYHKYQCQAPKK